MFVVIPGDFSWQPAPLGATLDVSLTSDANYPLHNRVSAINQNVWHRKYV